MHFPFPKETIRRSCGTVGQSLPLSTTSVQAFFVLDGGFRKPLQLQGIFDVLLDCKYGILFSWHTCLGLHPQSFEHHIPSMGNVMPNEAISERLKNIHGHQSQPATRPGSLKGAGAGLWVFPSHPSKGDYQDPAWVFQDFKAPNNSFPNKIRSVRALAAFGTSMRFCKEFMLLSQVPQKKTKRESLFWSSTPTTCKNKGTVYDSHSFPKGTGWPFSWSSPVASAPSQNSSSWPFPRWHICSKSLRKQLWLPVGIPFLAQEHAWFLLKLPTPEPFTFIDHPFPKMTQSFPKPYNKKISHISRKNKSPNDLKPKAANAHFRTFTLKAQC